jgi:predicted secreted hydrolase
VVYPLGWTVNFPEKNLSLHLTAAVQNQEMPILGPGASIWEGLCRVTAVPIAVTSVSRKRLPIHGVAYMELVGYSSPAVKKRVGQGK